MIKWSTLAVHAFAAVMAFLAGYAVALRTEEDKALLAQDPQPCSFTIGEATMPVACAEKEWHLVEAFFKDDTVHMQWGGGGFYSIEGCEAAATIMRKERALPAQHMNHVCTR